MTTTSWHYSRTGLAQQVLGMFESGLSNALTFFAPRRMGKTEFLLKDIMPLAKDHDWKVFYFSFLDVGAKAETEFTKALQSFIRQQSSLTKTRKLFHKVSKISGEAIGIRASLELHAPTLEQGSLKEIFAHLGQNGHILWLLDEVQALTQDQANLNFIATLRTGLDMHKDAIKVIFTGSSQEGLRRMFSQAKAPFFHFGQNLPFPMLDRGFTDHLANMFAKVTKRRLNKEILWDAFQEMQFIPQLARALVERLALHPDLTLEDTKQQLLNEIFNDRAFVETWTQCNALEQLLLHKICGNAQALFSNNTRAYFADILGTDTVGVPAIQSALRSLQRRNLVGKNPEGGGYFIDDPNFKHWLLQIQQHGIIPN